MYTPARNPGLDDSFTPTPGRGLQHLNSRPQTINMRFSTIASIFVSALSVVAQTSSNAPTSSDGDDALGWTVELLQELIKVPDCAVRI